MTERCFDSATSSSTFTPPLHPFDETTPLLAIVSGAPDIASIAPPVDSNASHPDGDSGIAATSPPDGAPLGFACEDPQVVAAPALHKPRSGEPVEEIPGGDPTELTVDARSLSMQPCVPIPIRKTGGKVRAESSYVGSEDRRQVDHVSASEAGDGAGTEVFCISSASEGVGTRSNDADSGIIDKVHEEVNELDYGRDQYLADDKKTATGHRMPCAVTVLNKHSTEEAHERGSGRTADIAAMMESFRGLSHSENNLLPHMNGDHVPIHGRMRAGDTLPLVDPQTLSVPAGRARTRGVLIIGGGAPIRIDEGIEVCLIESVGGQIDIFI